MSFLEEYKALSRPGVAPADVAKRQFSMLQEWVVKHPDEMFEDLRAHAPVFVTPAATVVSRYRDVIEVIDHDDGMTHPPDRHGRRSDWVKAI